jgi:hypothetical protein
LHAIGDSSCVAVTTQGSPKSRETPSHNKDTKKQPGRAFV